LKSSEVARNSARECWNPVSLPPPFCIINALKFIDLISTGPRRSYKKP
jgi:hypothetical protein